jgi:hypothetical protein
MNDNGLAPDHPVREELAKVSSLVLTARRLVAGGALVDLSALQGRVQSLCESVQQMPLEVGRDLRPDLDALIVRLDTLAGDLRQRLQQLPQPPDDDSGEGTVI